MLKWLSKLFRRKRDRVCIRCVVDGVEQDRAVVGVSGSMLVVSTDSGEHLVGISNCRDSQAYNKIWNRLSPLAGRLVWPDGTPFDPSRGDSL